METAKVEIRKLQVLCERINSMIDALNQVRLSVHGLSHSTATVPTYNGAPWITGSWQNTAPWQTNIPYQFNLVSPWQANNPWQSTGTWNSGITHTNPWMGYQTQVGWIPGGTCFAPYNTSTSVYGTRNTPPYYPAATATFAHTTGATYMDPMLAARIATNFPFAFANGTPQNVQ